MKPNNVFNDTIGQETAVIQLSESIASAANGGEMASPLLSQEAGGGKTHLQRRYLQGLEKEGIATLFFSSPEEFRTQGANFDKIVQLVTSGERYAIGIDEAHLFHHRPTVQMEKVFAFVMKALDRNNHHRSFNFDGQTLVNFNRKLGSISFATNFPDALDKSGALQSRFDKIELKPYSEEELVQILQIMLKDAGFQAASEKTLGKIARCGRGTARPMEKIIGQIAMSRSASGETRKTINCDDVCNALKLKQMFPRGLTPDEVQMLIVCETPRRDSVIAAFLPQMERNIMKKAKGFLMLNGFAEQTPQGFCTTPTGNAYIAQLKKEGFKFDKTA